MAVGGQANGETDEGLVDVVAQLTVIDRLYVALAQREHDRTVKDLQRAHEAVLRHTQRRPRA